MELSLGGGTSEVPSDVSASAQERSMGGMNSQLQIKGSRVRTQIPSRGNWGARENDTGSTSASSVGHCASPKARARKHWQALHTGAAGHETCITSCFVFILHVLGDAVVHVFQQKFHGNRNWS